MGNLEGGVVDGMAVLDAAALPGLQVTAKRSPK